MSSREVTVDIDKMAKERQRLHLAETKFSLISEANFSLF